MPDLDSLRRARGLFNIVGEVSKSSFGAATVKDQNVLERHIEHIEGTTAETVERVNMLQDDLSSYLVKHAKHDQLIEDAINVNRQFINLTGYELRRQVETTRIIMADAINFLHLTELHYTTTLADIYEELRDRVQGLHVLLRGYLPPELVGAQELKETIKTVSKALMHMNVELSHPNHAYYYHLNDIAYKRQGDMLYIKIKMPLTQEEALFRVFRAHAFPLPMDSESTQYTTIKLEHQYLALSHSENYYALLTEQEFDECTGHSYRRCDSAFKVYKSTTPSCLFSLYMADTTMVTQHCDTVLTATPEDFAVSLSDGEYYITTNDESWTQICHGHERSQLAACSHCVITLPCGCGLLGKNLRIPPRLKDCLNSTSLVALHGVNLPTLLAFYKDSQQILSIPANRRYAHKIKANLPSFKLVQDKYKDVAGRLKMEDISLQKLVDHVQGNRKIYATPSAKLRDELGILTSKRVGPSLFGLSGLSLLVSFLALFLALRNARIVMLASAASGLVIQPPGKPTPREEPRRSEVNTAEVVAHSSWAAAMTVLSAVTLGVMITFTKRTVMVYFSQTQAQLPMHSTVKIIFYSCGRFAMAPLLVYPGDVNKIRIRQRDDFKLPSIRKTG
jgi:hypothetical protein